MKLTQRLWQAFLLASLLGVSARGSMTFLAESRLVSASNSMGASASASLLDPGPFDAEASVSCVYAQDRRYRATASQQSALSPYGITAQGAAEEWEPLLHYESFAQESHSLLHAVFTTDASGAFLLAGALQTWGDYGGTSCGAYLAEVELSGEAGTIFSASVDPAFAPAHGDSRDIHEILTLNAGTYTLDIGASAVPWFPVDPGSIGGSGYASYDIQLVAIPAPGAILLAVVGTSLVGWLRRSRRLGG